MTETHNSFIWTAGVSPWLQTHLHTLILFSSSAEFGKLITISENEDEDSSEADIEELPSV